MNKCLIAGLPDAGKSTYIAALSYILEHPSDQQALRIYIRNDDRAYINQLSEAWLNQEALARTTQGEFNRLTFSITDKNADKFNLTIPDIAGEEFKSLLQNRDSFLDDWDADCNGLLFFINKLPDLPILQEQIGETNQSSENVFPEFSVDRISIDIQIILLIKTLLQKFPIKNLVICISAWDELIDVYTKPAECITERCPILYNFVMHYFPDCKIFGVSAQGGSYNDEIVDTLYENTINNSRAYIVTPDGEKIYDITLPLESFIHLDI